MIAEDQRRARMLNKLLQSITGKATEQGTAKQQPSLEHQKALDAQLSALNIVSGGHEKHRFLALYGGLYEQVLESLKAVEASLPQHRELELADLMHEARVACGLRRIYLLPRGRKNINYRQYETVYNYALVSAMAVERLRGAYSAVTGSGREMGAGGPEGDTELQNGRPQPPPDAWAAKVIPLAGLEWLREDAMVWQDWLEYFTKPKTSAMADIARKARSRIENKDKPEEAATPSQLSTEEFVRQMARQHAPEASRASSSLVPENKIGWQIVEAIKASLANGSLAFNERGSIVQIDQEGNTFLELPGIFEWYKEATANDATIQELTNQFKHLRIVKTREEGKDIFRGRLLASEKWKRGFVLGDGSAIWPEGAPRGKFRLQGLQ
jgi:hypothetical protein